MFMISMPKTFKVGTTQTCKVNGDATTLTWINKGTLRIGASDVRKILHVESGSAKNSFICADATGGGFVAIVQ